MSLREDFRNALGSIAAAVPEAVRTMRHGEEERGQVVQSSSRDFADPVSDTSPAEVARYIANAADFPTLDEGAAVSLGESLRVVVSLKTDPVGATFTVGLSAEMCETRLEVVTRTGSRNAETLNALVSEEDERLAFAEPYGGARGAERVYTVLVREDDWHRPEPLDVGDAVRFDSSHGNVRGAVSRVRLHRGCFILTVLERGA